MEVESYSSDSDSKDEPAYSPYDRLRYYLDRVMPDSPIFGPLESGILQMPLVDTDGRVLTWEKTIRRTSEKIVNNPKSDLWCWLAPANTDDGTRILKLSPHGSANKWRTAKALHVMTCCSSAVPDSDPQSMIGLGLWNMDRVGLLAQYTGPEAFDVAHTREVVAAHLCRNGQKKNKHDSVCINPFHITLVPQYVNVSHHACEHGCRELCPHGNCIWTRKDTGEPKYCLHEVPLNLTACNHLNKCGHSL